MVTLVGAGGSGKSRLAAELARRSLDHWPDGVWWIDLAGTDDVVGTVVATAELPGRGRPIDVVTSWLAMRHALLVLDNCEHLIAASAAFCQAALERCPLLSIMATSREPLGIAGEARWPLTALGDTDALHLFEARARLVRSVQSDDVWLLPSSARRLTVAHGRSRQLDGGRQVNLDLAGLSQVDSAGLATVLALLAHARSQGKTLSVTHAPAGLQALARVSGVDSLF